MSNEKRIAVNEVLQMGLRHYEKGELQQAEAMYNAVLKEQPNNYDALNLLGILALQVNKADIAEGLISKSLAIAPNNVCALFHFGRVKEAMQKYDEAIAVYKNVVERDPNYASAYNNMGNIYSGVGDYDNAIIMYEEALLVEPNNSNTMVNLGNAYKNYNDIEKSIAMYERALEINSSNYGAYIGLGNAYSKVRHFSEAIEYYGKAEKLAPDIGTIYLGFGNAYKELQQFDDAIKAYERSLQISPNSPGILSNIGYTLYLKGEPEAAMGFYEKAIKADSNYVGTYCNMGASQVLLGKLDDAVASHKKSISLLIDQLGKPKKIKVNRKSLPGSWAHEAFVDFCDVMSSNNIKFFLCFGTLLGFIREGDFLSFDKDIDLGVFQDVTVDMLVHAFENSEKFTIDNQGKDKNDNLVVSMDHENGAGFDIFIHQESGDKLLAGVYNKTASLYWAFSGFSLVEKEFIGKKVFIPENYHLYLEEIYGDWQTPDRFFDSIISGRNLQRKGCKIALCYGLNKIYDNIVEGDGEKALKLCQQMKKLIPDDDFIDWVIEFLNRTHTPNQLRDIASNLFNNRQYAKSAEYFEKAVKSAPNDWRNYFDLAIACESLGKMEEAEENYLKSLSINPNHSFTYYNLSSIKLKRQTTEWLINNINNLITSGTCSDDDLGNLNYALGKIYDTEKQYDQAFKHLKIANDFKHKTSNFDITTLKSELKKCNDIFSDDFLEGKKDLGSDSTQPLFLVGVPRCGSTLIEQIITSHLDAVGVGEVKYIGQLVKSIPTQDSFADNVKKMNKADVDKLANHYLQAINKSGDKKSKIINKQLENFYYIGFILFLFPNAKIINCKRHPLDVCLSMYRTNFLEIRYANSFKDMADYYKLYKSFIDRWQTSQPEKIYDVYYEDLIANQEEVSRNLIDFCDLSWDEQCLDFQNNDSAIFTASKWQARKPLYSDSAMKWKKYDAHIGELKELLANEIKEYESMR